ncbi:MAG: rhomboid family intramembrane serine protease [bacterium]
MHILIVLGLFAVAVSLASLVPRGLDPRRWPPPAVAAIALGVYGHLAAAGWALLAAFIAAALGLLAPAAIATLARRRAARGDFAGAARAITPLARLGPGWRDWQTVWRAAAAFHAGDPAPARALAADLAADPSPRARLVRDALLGLTRDWPAARHALAVDLQARALCELGEVDAGVETAARVWSPRMGYRAIRAARGVMLAPMAFAGEVDAVRALAAMMRLPPAARVIWEATAHAAAGDPATARGLLQALLTRPLAPALRHAAEARLEALPAPPRLGESARAVIADTRAELAAGAFLRPGGWRASPVTVLLLALIAVGFALQLARGGGDPEGVALELGALYATGRMPADHWRLLAYGFLHAGVIHLAANAVAIALLGPLVDRALGGLATLAVFLGGVVIGGVGISHFGGEGTTVGASAGAMALLTAALLVSVAHPRARATRTGRAIGRLGLVLVVMQTAFDAVTPQISSAGHISGALAGLALGAAALALLRR